ncbi:MAG: hypothetical protein OXI43_22320 [Candidatus Poribacteria bacterium]|nr:hypothetical protein [Candidatus Poribacteria bacterium]
MKRNFGTLALLAVILIAATVGCERSPQQIIPTMPTDDEESTVQLALDETYDKIRNGAHLIMLYDAATNSFTGTVENTTSATLTQVRVEIHLSNGIELGPTTPVDLAPGEQIPIELMAEGPAFDTWTAHPEVGPNSGSGSEGANEGAEGGAESGGEGAEGGSEGGGEHGQGGHN